MEIKQTVLDTLKSSKEPLKSGEIAEKCGQGKDVVDKAIKVLLKEDLVTSPKRCYYQAK